MKILQMVPYFYPAWSYGGPAKLVYDTSVYYAQKGHLITVYTSDAYDKQSRMPQSLHVSVKNLNVKYFKNFNNFLTYTYNIFFTPGLFITALREVKKFDIIHIHDFYTLQNFWVGFLARIFKIPYVLSVHGCLEDERVKQRSLFKQFFYKLYGRQLLLHASKVVATSKNEAKAYKQHGIHNSKIFILGHGIHPEEFITTKSKRECKKHFSIPSKNQVVTFLGRIHKVKGLDLLVRAISLLKNPSITFVIAGSDDGYLNELKASISKFQISNRVVLLPACFGEEKSMLFKTSDVFVYPSYSEGFSLGILEAAAAYLPLVITTGCHFPDVSRSESGIVVPPLPEKIAEAISTLITNSKLREKYSKNAFTLINEKYSMSYIGNTLLSEYAKII